VPLTRHFVALAANLKKCVWEPPVPGSRGCPDCGAPRATYGEDCERCRRRELATRATRRRRHQGRLRTLHLPPATEDAVRAQIHEVYDAMLRFDALRNTNEAGRLSPREEQALRALNATFDIAQRLEALLPPRPARRRAERRSGYPGEGEQALGP
jgi:hypothetical protein